MNELEMLDVAIELGRVKTKTIHHDLGACWEIDTGKFKRGRPVIGKHKAYVHRRLYAEMRGKPLRPEECLYKLCLNDLCVRPSHHQLAPPGKTIWYTKDWNLFHERKQRMTKMEQKKEETGQKTKVIVRKQPKEFEEQDNHVRQIARGEA